MFFAKGLAGFLFISFCKCFLKFVMSSMSLQNGNDPALSSPSPTRTPAAQSSISASLQPFPVFRQPYPLNYFTYSHFLTPIYMPPIHQLLSHNAFAQQSSGGNLYVPPTIAAPGVKLPFPMFKPGTNTAPPIGIPSGYPSVGYAASPTVTSGIPATNEDLAASQLKENHIYSTAQLVCSQIFFSLGSDHYYCFT